MEPYTYWHQDGLRYIRTSAMDTIKAVFGPDQKLQYITVPTFLKDARSPGKSEQIAAAYLSGTIGSPDFRRAIYEQLLVIGFEVDWNGFERLHFDPRIKPSTQEPWSDDSDSEMR